MRGPGDRIGDYLLGHRIGEGAMGEVYEALHGPSGRRCALKLLSSAVAGDPEAARRFLNEALAAVAARHPGIVAILDHGAPADGPAYLVMEHLAGETLAERLLRGGGWLPQAEVVSLGAQAAAALGAAHAVGVVHRDLKPANIVLVPAPDGGADLVKLVDFGIAKVAAEHQARAGAAVVRTQDGVMIGTPEYAAPEQWTAAASIDDRADVYALGVVLYRALAGRLPFCAGRPSALMRLHLYQEPAPLPELLPSVLPALGALVARMLAKARARRPPMSEVEAALGRLHAAAAARPAAAPAGSVPALAEDTRPGGAR